jgi:type VI secretion system protein ImpH
LLEALSAQPYTFDFFRAVRLLQCAFADRPRIGSSRSPEEDPVRFGQRPSLAFAPSTLDGLQPGPRPRLYVNFFGLFGPTGPLPLHLTDYAIRRQLGQKAETGHEEGRDQRAERASSRTELPSSRKDYTLSAFLDVFHHRLISLFFLAWARNQQVVDFDRPKGQRFPFYLGTFFGLGNEANEHGEFEPFEDALPAWAKLYYAGHLACPTRHAEGLRSVIEDYFGVATRAETFRGRWLDLPPENQCRLGGSPEAGCLGLSVVAGARIWDSQLSFRLRLGPMSFRDFQRFLPGSRSLQRLSSWVTNYVGTQYFWDLQLVLKAEEVPETVLRRDRPPQAGRLGWTIWLKSQPMARDSEDLVLNPGS